MSESAIRTQIYTILSGVTDIGKVYDYDRWAVDWGVFINLFKTTISSLPQIRGWEIGRQSVNEEKLVVGIVGANGNEVTHEYVLRGYMTVMDANASEKTFNALVEAVAAAFRAKPTLNGAAFNTGYLQGIIDTRMFGSVLCHYAELSLTVRERV